jgi:hypothetical protein
MPNAQKNRGQHPEDAKLFGENHLDDLRSATADLSWLLGRGYAMNSSVKLVGDRYRLNTRQRKPIQRCACSESEAKNRRATALSPDQLKGQVLAVDGFNLIISVEAALSGALLFLGRDGCIRDIASIHGSYRSVNQTEAAIELIGTALAELEPESVNWYLDQPISNSGRLKVKLLEKSTEKGWPWQAELAYNPDHVIAAAEAAIALSGDSWVIDNSKHWFNFLVYLLEQHLPEAIVVDLSGA